MSRPEGGRSFEARSLREPGASACEAMAMSLFRAKRAARGRLGAVDSDAELVSRAQAGEREAFEELVRRHADHLYSVVRHVCGSVEEAEDVAQESFLRAWRSIGSFRSDARFFTWLYRIGINEAKRRRERQPPSAMVVGFDGGVEIDPPDVRAAPDERASEAEVRRALERAVRALPLKYRAPLILRDIEGLSNAEAASVLELGEAAFKSRLHRARSAVRKAVEQHVKGAP
jgi:RNA polymerase sigma-70 factor (ECF subfamily)